MFVIVGIAVLFLAALSFGHTPVSRWEEYECGWFRAYGGLRSNLMCSKVLSQSPPERKHGNGGL